MAITRKLLGQTITRDQWLLRETRIIADLRLQGLDEKAVTAKVTSENLFQYGKLTSVKEVARACHRRIEAVESDEIVRIVAYGHLEASAQANLYMMMCTYPLVHHFMLTEIGRRFADLDYSFTKVDMNAYFTKLEEEYVNFASASDGTIAKLKQVLRRCLVESGMLAHRTSERLIPPILDLDVRDAIEAKGDTQALVAFNVVEVI
ncbi:MAG: DUF1819 family protein [Actinomycetaceae bacterium]|nr:DUF1819 family protein [Actinomycetaceae bacterium]